MSDLHESESLEKERKLEKKREYNRQWRLANPDKCREYRRRYRIKCPEKLKQYAKTWYDKNREKISDKRRTYYLENQDRFRAYREINREARNEYYKRWYRRLPNRLLHNQRAKQRYQLKKTEAVEYGKSYRQRNGLKISQDRKERYRKYTKFSLASFVWRAKRRAKEKNLPFNIDASDILIPQICPVLGIPIVYSTLKGGSDGSPTLDRIIPELGYIKGNVVIISKRANAIKHNASLDELKKIVRWLEECIFCPLPQKKRRIS